MTTRRLAIISIALIMSAHLVACSDDDSNTPANNGVVDAGSDAVVDDTDIADVEQDTSDVGDASDASDAVDVSDLGDVSDAADTGGDANDAGDAGADGQSDGQSDADLGPQPDDLDPTGGQWSQDYAMPGLQGQSGARGYVLADNPTGDGFYVGGIFDVAGGSTASQIAHWDGIAWNKMGASSIAIDVHALAADSAGNVYAGGEGGGGGGIGIGGSNSIEMWDGTSWTTFADIGGGFGTVVYDIEILSDGRIVVGGEFGSVDLNALENLAVWDGQSWSMLGNGDSPTGAVQEIVEMSDGSICIGGDFADIGTLNVNRIACWDGTQWTALGAGMNSTVYALLEDAGDLLAAGSFSVPNPNGGSTIGVARWDGTSWQGVADGVHGGSVTSVRALAHGPSGELFVGGTFTSVGPTANAVGASNIAVLDNGQWSALGSGVQNTVGAVLGAVTGVNDFLIGDSGGNLLTTGLFSLAGGKFSLNIGEWKIGATDDTGWSKKAGAGEFAGADMAVVTLASAPSGVVYAAGRFTTIGAKQIDRVARYQNGSWQPMPDAITGDVAEVVVDSTGKAYFGGAFTAVTSTQNISNLVVWDGTSWSAMSSAVPGQVVTMTLDANDKLYVATGAAGQSDFRVFEWTGANWQQLGSAFTDTITTMAVLPGGDLYIGGQFNEDANGTPMVGIARWDGTAWVDVAGGVGEFDYVTDMTIYDGKLLVVGKMGEVGGQTAGSVALWDGTSWDTLGGGLPPRFPNGPAPTVTVAAAKANGFFVSGTFPAIGQQTVNYIAWWDGQDWHALGDGLSDLGEAMAIADHQLFVGGPFTAAGGHPSYHIGVWGYQPTP